METGYGPSFIGNLRRDQTPFLGLFALQQNQKTRDFQIYHSLSDKNCTTCQLLFDIK